jgi:hypothetical protein
MVKRIYHWGPAELGKLLKLWDDPTMSKRRIAAELGIPYGSMHYIEGYLGLPKKDKVEQTYAGTFSKMPRNTKKAAIRKLHANTVEHLKGAEQQPPAQGPKRLQHEVQCSYLFGDKPPYRQCDQLTVGQSSYCAVHTEQCITKPKGESRANVRANANASANANAPSRLLPALALCMCWKDN